MAPAETEISPARWSCGSPGEDGAFMPSSAIGAAVVRAAAARSFAAVGGGSASEVLNEGAAAAGEVRGVWTKPECRCCEWLLKRLQRSVLVVDVEGDADVAGASAEFVATGWAAA